MSGAMRPRPACIRIHALPIGIHVSDISIWISRSKYPISIASRDPRQLTQPINVQQVVESVVVFWLSAQ